MLKLIYFKSFEDQDRFFRLVDILPDEWYREPVANTNGGWILHHPKRCEHIYDYLKELHCFEEEEQHEH